MALQGARAIASAIVLTAKILRDEPHLSYAPDDAVGEAREALRKHRGLMSKPELIVLTRNREGALPLDHPLLKADNLTIFTNEEGAARARNWGLRAEVPNAGELSIRAALRYGARHGGVVSVEAGPSASHKLFTPEVQLDRMWLSRYSGPCSNEMLAAELFSDRAFQGAERTGSLETEGAWRFEGWRWPDRKLS